MGGGGGGGGGTDAGGWVTVVRGGGGGKAGGRGKDPPSAAAADTGKGGGPGDGSGGAGEEGGADQHGPAGGRQEYGQAPLARELPPPRMLNIPAMPRRTIVRKAQAAAERYERLQGEGAGEHRLHRALQEKERLEKEVREAGGPTEKALSFSIKAEDERVEKAERALRRAVEERDDKVARIAALQAELEDDDAGIERYRQRLQAAQERREHLAKQKWAETASEETIRHFRTIAAVLSPEDPAQAQAQAVVQRLVELMSEREEVHLAGGDTESEGREGGTEDEQDEASSNRTRLSEPRFVPSAEMEENEELRRRLREAEQHYAAVEEEKRAALGRVTGPLGGGKRGRDADEPKGQDVEGDEDMGPTPTLTGPQVEALFAERMRAAAEQVRHCRILLAREAVPKPPWELGPPPPSEGGGQQPLAEAPAPAGGSRQQQGDPPQGVPKRWAAAAQPGPQRVRGRRNPVETWVSAEDMVAAGSADGGVGDRTRQASAGDVPGRGRGRSLGSPPRQRGRSGSRQPLARRGAVAVALEYGRQQEYADDLERRVRDMAQIAEQERLQQQQEAERREAAAAGARAAREEVERHLEEGERLRQLQELQAASAGLLAAPQPTPAHAAEASADQLLNLLLDEQRRSHGADGSGEATREVAALRGRPAVPRRSRWCDEPESEEEGGRERSRKAVRTAQRSGAMETEE